jgi:hypothetical protein
VEEGWIWFIPVSADITSIGLVTKDQRKYTESEFLQILQRAPIPLNNASMVDVDGHKGLYYARDWSYQCKKFVGRNFALVGDAACFVDPILSGGVDFAIRGAANLALAILRYIENSDTTPLQEYQQMLFKEYQAYLRMARYWYANNSSVDGFFWEAYQEIEQPMHSTPMRAFVYLTSGRYAADQHFAIFQKWQEEKMFTALGVQKEHVQESIRLFGHKHITGFHLPSYFGQKNIAFCPNTTLVDIILGNTKINLSICRDNHGKSLGGNVLLDTFHIIVQHTTFVVYIPQSDEVCGRRMP